MKTLNKDIEEIPLRLIANSSAANSKKIPELSFFFKHVLNNVDYKMPTQRFSSFAKKNNLSFTVY